MLQNLPEEGLGREVETLQTIAKKLSGVCDWFGHLFSQSDVFKAIIIIIIIIIFVMCASSAAVYVSS